MGRFNHIANNFVGGELSPKLHARFDLPIYQKSLALCENFIIQLQGGASYRNGSQMVHTTKGNKKAVLLPFQFNDQQSYLIEATDSTFRFYANNGIILGSDALVTAINNANPGVIKSIAHGFIVGDRIHIEGVNGMTGLNGNDFIVNTVVNPNKFTIKTLGGVVVNTTSSGTYLNGGKITKVIVINGITSANPAVVTANAHGFNNGDEVYISGVSGLTSVNKRFFVVAGKTANTFQLTDIFGANVSTVGQGPYTTGGSVSKIYELTTPFLEEDLPYLQFAQDEDTMYIVNSNYSPEKLVRNSSANFSIGTFARTNDPFTLTDNPRCAAFIPGNRLCYGYTDLHPETLWASASPSGANSAFDNFTAGTLATSPVIVTLAPMQGKADTIQWISVTNQFAFIGVFGGLRNLYGATPDQGIDVNDIDSKPVNFYGCAPILPITTGENLFYVQRGQKIIRRVEFDYTVSGYKSDDLTEAADHLTTPLVTQIVFQQNFPDVLWGVRGDGKLIGLTYSTKNQIAGWHRHYLGGNSVDDSGVSHSYGKVLSLGIMPRPADPDQLWMVVERKIGTNTVRTVEYLADKKTFPIRQDFYSGDEAADRAAWQNAAFEVQKDSNHLDMATLYDGSALGQVTVTPGATTGNNITFSASAAIFTADMVGRQIWKKYDTSGVGGGKATITAFTDSTHVVCNIIKDFNSIAAMTPGNWFLTAITISGLNLWEGQTLSVIADGGTHPDCVVQGGAITLNQQSSKVWVGYKFRGALYSLNLVAPSDEGPVQIGMRRASEAAIVFLDTVGGKYGTSPYRQEAIVVRDGYDVADRPPYPRSASLYMSYTDSPSRTNKHFVVTHTEPVPLTVLSVNITMDVNK